MPAGVEAIEINPETGLPSAAGDAEKRTEYFINGTGPNHESSEGNEQATPEEEPSASPAEEATPEVVPTVAPLPSPSPRKPVTALPEGHLEGTITLDIDPTTGLLASDSCPVIRTKTFVLGTEPKRYCGPEYHRGKVGDSSSRPRVVGTPQP
jgi:membrane carboxypeptidase/penicillin-binding protein